MSVQIPKERSTDEQVTIALRQAEAGRSVPKLCRKMGVAEVTFYRWSREDPRSVRWGAVDKRIGWLVPSNGEIGEKPMLGHKPWGRPELSVTGSLRA